MVWFPLTTHMLIGTLDSLETEIWAWSQWWELQKHDLGKVTAWRLGIGLETGIWDSWCSISCLNAKFKTMKTGRRNVEFESSVVLGWEMRSAGPEVTDDLCSYLKKNPSLQIEIVALRHSLCIHPVMWVRFEPWAWISALKFVLGLESGINTFKSGLQLRVLIWILEAGIWALGMRLKLKYGPSSMNLS